MAAEKDMVSIVMPAYNMERYIEAAVCSVQAQTYENWELLVIDDCSRDATCEIVERLAAEDPRIRLIRNERNMGVAKTRNRGFELSRGMYVALLDSDDLWRKEKLERQLAVADSTGADVVFCSYGMIGEEGESVCDDFTVPASTNFEDSLTRLVISCSTALLSRKVYTKYRFSADYYHEDLVFWLQILRDGVKANGVTDVLADYRLHSGTRAANKIRSACKRWVIYRDYFGMSYRQSLNYLLKYALLGLKKYRRR